MRHQVQHILVFQWNYSKDPRSVRFQELLNNIYSLVKTIISLKNEEERYSLKQRFSVRRVWYSERSRGDGLTWKEQICV